jgi:hypothetical protein
LVTFANPGDNQLSQLAENLFLTSVNVTFADGRSYKIPAKSLGGLPTSVRDYLPRESGIVYGSIVNVALCFDLS